MKELDVEFCRSKFPALRQDFIFMDNAGGSHTLKPVVDKISEYLLNWDVQHGASYSVSQTATKKVENAVESLRELVNAKRKEEIIMGPSSTALMRIMSICLSREWKEGDEVIITNSEHEANGSCWTDLREKGIVIKYWKYNPETFELDLDDLEALMTDRTKLVSIVHVSNILGTINDIGSIAQKVHENGALIGVDGVAFAPHRRVDVRKWDVDFYVYSCYKTFGPHCGLMYGRYEVLAKLKGLNHYFLEDRIPYKFQPGNLNYELTYGMSGVCDYLFELTETHSESPPRSNHEGYKSAFQLIAKHEENLTKGLIDYLKGNEAVHIIGKATAELNERVSTISFIVKGSDSEEIVKKVDEYKIGIRFGDFYAKEIIKSENLIEQKGVIRVSLVHYNTMEEVNRLILALEAILD
jgi:cysteine desulfurase family protein (TIGR01976 family)